MLLGVALLLAAVPLSICLALIGMQQFARSFLDLRERWPADNKVTLAVIAFFVMLGLRRSGSRTASPRHWRPRRCWFGVLWIIVATVVMLRRGYRPAA